jgi:hypothetical protein
MRERKAIMLAGKKPEGGGAGTQAGAPAKKAVPESPL